MEVDLLIGDYSTLSTDFAILKKPQIFVFNDYDMNKTHKGVAEDFLKLLPGPVIFDFINFKKTF